MADRKKVIKGLQAHADGCGYRSHHCDVMDCPYRYGDESCDIEEMCRDALTMLKEQESLLGIQQTADGITFISTGTARQGEERGMLLGKAFMHEWIYKELLHKGLLTDDIRSVFEQAKHI